MNRSYDGEKTYTVYEHLFPDGRRYVGLTKQKPEARWGKNGSGYKRQPVFSAIQFFGWDNIQHNIIADGLSVEEAKELERKIILGDELQDIGWNRANGGGVGGSCIPMFEYNGKLLTSEEIAMVSPLKNLSGHDITNRVNEHGWTLERAMTQGKGRRKVLYSYKGKEYTVGELLRFSTVPGLTVGHLVTRLNRHGFDVHRALTQPLNVKKQPSGIGEKRYEYHGQMYNSYELSQISPIKDLLPSDIYNRITCKGWDVERALNTPKKQMDQIFVYEGIPYSSHELASIAVDKRMTYHDVTDRARSGWSTWEIVNIPKGTTRKQYYSQNNEVHICQSEAKPDESSKSSLEGSETNA